MTLLGSDIPFLTRFERLTLQRDIRFSAKVWEQSHYAFQALQNLLIEEGPYFYIKPQITTKTGVALLHPNACEYHPVADIVQTRR